MSIVIAVPVNEEARQKLSAIKSDLIFIDRQKEDPASYRHAEAVLGNLPVSVLKEMPELRWVQLDSAGADAYLSLPSSITLTNASGAYGTAISEYMLTCTLAAIRKFYAYDHLQKEREWVNLGPVKTIADLKVLCLGMGNIGTAYAERMHMLGAHVDGVRHSLKEKPACYDHQYLMADLDRILPDYDVIAMSLPATPETENCMNRERLARTRQGSILINVGRGSALDEDALLLLARRHHFSRVFLDVMRYEPLPKNNPLWNCEDITITPHIAGRFNAAVTYEQIIDILCTNLNHYLKQEPLEHIVDRTRGY